MNPHQRRSREGKTARKAMLKFKRNNPKNVAAKLLDHVIRVNFGQGRKPSRMHINMAKKKLGQVIHTTGEACIDSTTQALCEVLYAA